MKNKMLNSILVCLLVGLPSLAHAIPIMFTDEVTPPSSTLIHIDSNRPSLDFVHDFNDSGYNPITDTLISAELILVVRDDLRNEAFNDQFRDPMVAILDGPSHVYLFEVDLVNILQPVDISTILDGLLDVRLQLPARQAPEWAWDFYGSRLNVTAERREPMPLPGTLLLLGGGLVLIARSRRTRKKIAPLLGTQPGSLLFC